MKTATLLLAMVAMATAASVAEDSPVDAATDAGKFLLIRGKRKTTTVSVLATATATVPTQCDATLNLASCVPRLRKARRRRSAEAQPAAVLPEVATPPPAVAAELDGSLQRAVEVDESPATDEARLLFHSTTTVTVTIGTITVTSTNQASTQSVVFSSCVDIGYVTQLPACP